MIGEPDRQLPQPKEPPQPSLENRNNGDGRFNFDIRAEVRNYLKGLTLNGYPIDFEGNNMRIAAAAMNQSREIMQQRPIRHEVHTVLPIVQPIRPGMFPPPQTRLAPPPPQPPTRTPAPTSPIPPPRAFSPPPPPARQVVLTGRTALNRGPHSQGDALYRRKVDTTALSRSGTPIHFKRADNGNEILVWLDTAYSMSGQAQSDGFHAENPEQTVEKSKYYEASGGGNSVAFGLTGGNSTVTINPGILDAGTQGFYGLPVNMEEGVALEMGVSGSGSVYLIINVDLPTDDHPAEVIGVTINAGEMPDSTEDTYYLNLGTYTTNEETGDVTAFGAAGNQGYIYSGGHFSWAL